MFLHEAALVAVICLDTTVHASGIQDKLRHLESKTSSGQTFFEKEFKVNDSNVSQTFSLMEHYAASEYLPKHFAHFF